MKNQKLRDQIKRLARQISGNYSKKSESDFGSLPRYLSLKQTSDILHVHANTLRNWDKSGKLRAIRVGDRKDRRFQREDVERIYNELKQSAPGQISLLKKLSSSLSMLGAALAYRLGIITPGRSDDGKQRWQIHYKRSIVYSVLVIFFAGFAIFRYTSIYHIFFAYADNEAVTEIIIEPTKCEGWDNAELAKHINGFPETQTYEYIESNSAYYSNQRAFQDAANAIGEDGDNEDKNTGKETTSTIPSKTTVLKCSNFNLQEQLPPGTRFDNAKVDISFGADSFEGNEDVVSFKYSINSQEWETLDSFAIPEDVSNATHQGFWEYDLPQFTSFDNLNDTTITIEYNATPATQGARVFADGIALKLTIRKPPPKQLSKDLNNSVDIQEKDVSTETEPQVDIIIEDDSPLEFVGVDPRKRAMRDARLIDPTGTEQQVELSVAYQKEGDKTTLGYAVPKDALNVPGKYTLLIDMEEGGYIETVTQDFSWGAIAVNVRSSVVTTDTFTEVGVSVVDDAGVTVCDAGLSATITHPNRFKEKFTTADKTIVSNPDCADKTFTTEPDYLVMFTTTDEGGYVVDVHAETKNGSHDAQMRFEVKKKVDFAVERKVFPSRIFPEDEYPVSFIVTATEDFQGVITEQVPSILEISDVTNQGVLIPPDEANPSPYQTIAWTADLRAGKAQAFGYTIKFPYIAPELYQLGPIAIGDQFIESRQWQIVADSVGVAQATRVYSTGFENRSTIANVEITSTSGTAPTIDTTTYRSGSAALQTSASSATSFARYRFVSSNSADDYYVRAYVYITTRPTTTTIPILSLEDSTPSIQASLRLTSSGYLELYNNEDSALIGTSGSALSNNTWYRLELRVDCTTIGSTLLDGRIDGVSFASGTVNHANGVYQIALGPQATETSTMIWDDVGINNDSGAIAENWVGPGKIIHLRPNGLITNECDGSDYTKISDTTPDDASSYIACTDNNDTLTTDITDATKNGINENDTINVIASGTRTRRGTSGTSSTYYNFMTVPNTGDQHNGSLLSSTSTTWVSNTTTAPFNYPITDYILWSGLAGDGANAPITPTDLDSAILGIEHPNSTRDVWVSTLWLLVEYEPAEGGRLFSSGFELQSATSGMEWATTTGSPTVSTTNFRSGLASLQITSLSSGSTKSAEQTFLSANGLGPFFARAYIRVDTLPSANNRIMSFKTSGGADMAYLELTDTGTLALYDEDGQVGSASTVKIHGGGWARVELKIDASGAGSTDTVEAKINGASAFATSSTRNLSSGVNTIEIGGNLNGESQTTGDWYFDDVAVNQNAGSTQNDYPGSGRIVHMQPDAAGENTGWTNAYTEVDEVSPNDGTDYLETSSTTAIEDMNLESSSNAGIPASSSIKFVSVGVRHDSLPGGEALKVRLKNNTSAGGGGAVTIESRETNMGQGSYITNDSVSPRLYLLTSYSIPHQSTAWSTSALDTAQIGVRLADNLDGIGYVSTEWLLVEFTGPTATVSGRIYTDDAKTTGLDCVTGGSKTVKVVVDGSESATAECSNTPSNGTFSVSGVEIGKAGNVVTVFLDDETANAVTVTLSNDATSNITTADLIQDRIVTQHENAGSLTNVHLGAYNDNTDGGGGDLGMTASSTGTIATTSGWEVHVPAGETFTPIGDISFGGTNLTTVYHILGTATLDGSANTVAGAINITAGGSLTVNGATTSSGDGEAIFMDGGTLDIAASVTLSNGGLEMDGGTTTVTSTLNLTEVADGHIDVNGGTLNINAGADVDFWGGLCSASGSTINFAGGTTDGDNGSNSNFIFNGGTINLSGGTHRTGSGGAIEMGRNISTRWCRTDGSRGDTTFNMTGGTMSTRAVNLYSNYNVNTTTASGGTMELYTGTPYYYSVNSGSIKFYNFQVRTTGATFNSGSSQALSLNGAFIIDNGTTFDLLGESIIANGWTNNGTFTASSGSVQLVSGNVNGSSDTTFYNLTIGDGTTKTVTVNGSDDPTVSNNLTVTANDTLSIGANRIFTYSYGASNSFTWNGTLGGTGRFDYKDNGVITSTAVCSSGLTFRLDVTQSNTAANGRTWDCDVEVYGNGVTSYHQIQSGTTTFNGNVTLSHDGGGTTTLDWDTTAQTSPAINGNLTIGSGTAFEAPSETMTVKIEKTLTNNGTFYHNNGTVLIDGPFVAYGVYQITGSSDLTFYSLTISGNDTYTGLSSTDVNITVSNNVTFDSNNALYPGSSTTFTVANGATMTCSVACYLNGDGVFVWQATATSPSANMEYFNPAYIRYDSQYGSQSITSDTYRYLELTGNNSSNIITTPAAGFTVYDDLTLYQTGTGTTEWDMDTYDGNVTIGGDFLFGSNTLIDAGTGTIDLDGDLTKQANTTFQRNTGGGTLLLSGTALQTIDATGGPFAGSGSLQNLTITNSSGSDPQSDPSVKFLGTVSVYGTYTINTGNVKVQYDSTGNTEVINFNFNSPDANKIYLRSTVAGTRFHMHYFPGSATINDVDVKDASNDYPATTVIPATDASNVNSGNTYRWNFGNILVTGTVYSNVGSGAYNCSSNNLTIKASVNGDTTPDTGTCTSAAGTFSFTGTAPGAANQHVVVWIDSSESVSATTATLSVNEYGDIAVDLYLDYVVIDSESGTAMTNALLDTYDSGNDAGIDYTITSSNLTMNASHGLYLAASYTPGGTVTTPASSTNAGNVTTGGDGDLVIASGKTLTMAANALSVGGDFDNNGTLSTSSNTTTFTGTTTGFTIDNVGATYTFGNITFNGSGGGWSFTGTTTMSGDLTMTAGTLSGTSSVTVSGGDVTGNGDINMTGGTFTVGSSSGNFGGDTAWDFYSLFFDHSGTSDVTATATGSGSITVSNILTLDATYNIGCDCYYNHILAAGSKTWILSGGGTPLADYDLNEYSGLDTQTSTFRYTGTTATNIHPTWYYILELQPGSSTSYYFNASGWWTYVTYRLTMNANSVIQDSNHGVVMAGTTTLEGGGQTIRNLTIGGGTCTISTSNITVSGVLTVSASSTITIGSGRTLTYTGSGDISIGGAGAMIDGAGLLIFPSGSGGPGTSSNLSLKADVRFDASSADVASTTFDTRSYDGDVEVYSNGTTHDVMTVNMPAGTTMVIGGSLTVNNSSTIVDHYLHLDASTGNPSISVSGDIDFTGPANAGGEMIITGSGDWTVSGNISPLCVYNEVVGSCITFSTGHQLIMDGTSKTLTSQVFSGYVSLYDFTVQGTISTTNYVQVSNDLLISSGTLTSGTRIYIGNSFTNNASFTHNNGTVWFNGAAPSIGGSAATTAFYSLYISPSGTGTVTHSGGTAITIANAFTITASDSYQTSTAKNTELLSTGSLTLTGSLIGSGWFIYSPSTAFPTSGTISSKLDFNASGWGTGPVSTISGRTYAGEVKVECITTQILGRSAQFSASGYVFSDVTFAGANCGGLTVDANTSDPSVQITGSFENALGSTFEASSATEMDFLGNYRNLGNFIDNGGTVRAVGGAVTQTFSGEMTGSSDDFYNFTIEGDTSLIVLVSDPMDVGRNLTITKGTLDTNVSESNDITVGGNWTNNATFEARNSTVTFTGAALPGDVFTIDSTDALLDDFYSIEFNDSGDDDRFVLNTPLDVNGDLTITGGDFRTQDFPINIAGSWTNADLFDPGSSYVEFDGGDGSVQEINGDTTFNDFTASTANNSAGRTLRFEGNSTTTVNGTWTIAGDDGKIITLESSDTNQWTIAPANASVTYVQVSNSNNTVGIICATYSTDTGDNNTNWTVSAGGGCGVTVSGNIYTAEGSGAYDCSANNLTVAIRVNGSGSYSGTCTQNTGYYEIASVNVGASNVVTIFLDNETPNATTVLRALDSSTAISANLYQNRLIVRHEDSGPITNSDLDYYDDGNGGSDGDVMFAVTSNNLSVNDGAKLLVWTGDTFTPGGTITTSPSSTTADADGDVGIQASATLSMGTYALSVGGDFVNAGTFSKSTNQTTTFTATGTGFSITPNASAFDYVIFNGAGGGWTNTAAMTVDNNVTVSNGVFGVTNDLTVNGATSGGVIVNGGEFNVSSGTVAIGNGTDEDLLLNGGDSALSGGSITVKDDVIVNNASSLLDVATTLVLNGSSTSNFTHTNGTIEIETGADVDFSGVYDKGGASSVLTVNGGSISGTTASSSHFQFNGGTVNINGGSLYTGSNAIVEIARANGSSPAAVTINMTGGDVYARSYSIYNANTLTTTTMDGGTFHLGRGGSQSTTVLYDTNTSMHTFYNLVIEEDAQRSAGASQVTLPFKGSCTLNTGIAYAAGSYGMRCDNGWVNNGNFTADTSTITLRGGNISGSSNSTFYNLTIGDGTTTNTVTMTGSDSPTITNTFSIDAGDTFTGSNNVTANGAFSGAGTVTLTGGTMLHRIAAGQNFGTTSGTANWTFNNLSFENSSGSDVIVTFPAGTGQYIVNGTLTVGSATDTNETQINAWTNNRILDVGGDVVITSHGEIRAPYSAAFTVAGNWANNGDFDSGIGTVTFDGTGSKTLTGQMTASTDDFYNLVFDDGGAALVATLEDPINVANDLTITNGTLDTKSGESNAITVGGSWSNSDTFTPQSGTVTFTATTTGKTIAAGSSAFHNIAFSGSGGEWTATSALDVNGTFTLTNGAFIQAANGNVNVADDFTLSSGTTFTKASGSGKLIFDGDLVFADNTSPQQNLGVVEIGGSPDTIDLSTDMVADAATILAGANILNTNGYDLDLGTGGLTVNGTFDGTDDVDATTTVNTEGNVTIDSGATFTHDNNTQIIFDATSGTKDLTTGGKSLYDLILNDGGGGSLIVEVEDTLDVDHDVVISNGTLDTKSGESNAITVGGSWTTDDTFTARSGTVTFNATTNGKTIDAGTSAFNNIAFDGSGGEWTMTTALDVNGTFTLSNGTFVQAANDNVNVAGNFTIANGTTFTPASGTGKLIFDGDLTFADNRASQQDIGDVQIGTSPDTTNLSTDMTAKHLVVSASDYLYTNGYDLNIGKNGIEINGTLDVDDDVETDGTYIKTQERFHLNAGATLANSDGTNAGSTLEFNIDPAAAGDKNSDLKMDGTGTLYNLKIDDGGGTYTLTVDLKSAITVDNDLTIAGGKLDVGNGLDYGIDIKGDWTNNDTFEAQAGEVTASGTAQQTFAGTMTGGSAFYDLTITNASGSNPDTSPSVIFTADAETDGTFTAATANTKLRFDAGNTYTFQNIDLDGQATGTRVFLRSSSNGTQWNINVAGTRSVSNTDVKDSDACGQAPDIDATDGTNYDSLNNDCWLFHVMSFSISDLAIGFGPLNASNARFATGDTLGSDVEVGAHTLTATTNAPNGYAITVNGDTLTSGSDTITAIGGTALDSSPGSEQFGIRLTVSSGNGTVTAPYNDNTPKWAYAATAGNPSQVASGSGDGVADVFSVRYISNIGSLTEAGNYSTDLMYIMTATF